MSDIKIIHGDCMDYLPKMKDNEFSLAIVDPDYGIGEDWKKRNKGRPFKETTYKNNKIPSGRYFKELLRVSRSQIIWGYNYYVRYLGPTNYLIAWDKKSNNNNVFKYSKFELAYTNIKIPANLVSIPWDGYRMGHETGIRKIHPHQKPIELYKWLLTNYAKPGQTILDTHLGSGSSAIACHDYGYDLTAYEIDKEYFEAATERIERHMSQGQLFQAIG